MSSIQRRANRLQSTSSASSRAPTARNRSVDSGHLASPVSTGSTLSTTTPAPTESPASSPVTTVALTAEDGALLEHFVKCTAHTLNDRDDVQPVFHTIAPTLASTRPYLMFCILAIAGQHKLSQQRESSMSSAEAVELRNRILSYQHRSLSLYKEEIQDAWTIDESMAACLGGIFVLINSLASFQITDANSPSPLEKSVEILRLLAGVGHIFLTRWSQIERSAIGIFLSAYKTPNPEIALDEDTRATLAGIEALLAAERLAPSTREVYGRALAGLRNSFRASVANPHDVGYRLGWIREYDARYLAEQIEAREATALVLVAHWAAELANWQGVWWEHGLGRAVVEDVVKILPEAYHRYVQWPMRRCQL